MDKKTIFKAVEVVGETKYNYYEIIEFSKNTINKFKLILFYMTNVFILRMNQCGM